MIENFPVDMSETSVKKENVKIEVIIKAEYGGKEENVKIVLVERDCI